MLRVAFFLLVLVPEFLLAGEICPLPTQQNVSYRSVTELDVRSPDEVVAYGVSELQFGELWLPTIVTQATERAPIVALVHGGCWLNAYDIQHTQALSGALADAGYAVWSIEYRRTGDTGGGWPGSLDDVIAGLNFIVQLTSEHLDLDSIAVMGHSAGGHLVMLASSDERLQFVPKLTLGLAPIMDIVEYAKGDNSCQTAAPSFMGGKPEEIPTEYKKANPAEINLKSNPRSLHGDLDSIVPLSQSTDQLPTNVVRGAGHFDFVHPHTPAFQAILRELANAL